jgi:hypothetical protein
LEVKGSRILDEGKGKGKRSVDGSEIGEIEFTRRREGQW